MRELLDEQLDQRLRTLFDPEFQVRPFDFTCGTASQPVRVSTFNKKAQP